MGISVKRRVNQQKRWVYQWKTWVYQSKRWFISEKDGYISESNGYICEKDGYSSKKDGYTSEKDYLHAANAWDEFKMKSLGDYHDLYLKTYVLLLADVLEKLINCSLKYYGLDPCHYYNSLGLNWDAMLKVTEIELKLILGIDMDLLVEAGMRGGISYICKRFSKPNNKYMTDYDIGRKVNSLFI